MTILFGYNPSLYQSFFQFSSWIVDSKLTKHKDWSALCKPCMRLFITGDWKAFDIGNFSPVEIKSFGQTFQGGVYCKGSLGSGFGCAAKRLRETLMAVVLAPVLWDRRLNLMILVITTPIRLFKMSFREFQFLAICGHRKTSPPNPM